MPPPAPSSPPLLKLHADSACPAANAEAGEAPLQRQPTLAGAGITPEFEFAQVRRRWVRRAPALVAACRAALDLLDVHPSPQDPSPTTRLPALASPSHTTQDMSAFPPAKHDALGLEELLTPAEKEVRDRVRRFAVCYGMG